MMDYDVPLSSVHFPEENDRKVVAEDWKQIAARSKALGKRAPTDTHGSQVPTPAKQVAPSKSKSFSLWRSAKDSKTSAASAQISAEKVDGGEKQSGEALGGMGFSELVTMNAGIINANLPLIKILLQLFETLLAPAVNGDEGSLDCACDVAALRIFREISGPILLKDFQTCLLASARALLPDGWDSKHESAWIAVWTCIADRLEQSLPLPGKYAKPVQSFVSGLSTEQRQKLGKRSFERLFREHEQVSHHFNQSWMRLAFIVSKTLDMTVRLFHEPAQMYDELTQLGLKHIMYQADSQFFQPWVAAVVAEIQLICHDEKVHDGMNFALCVVGGVIGQALEAGATPILKAIVTDDVKALKKALAQTPRSQRAEAVLRG
ncbi:SETD3 [Symbiodinium natans]|uniref:SETD3 protein n=1 Tax=Symbiodinium natans TaxID=878477 RepID=A0A812QTR1_9DINO|nr:SETD3 [Symbiodinium natans]